jgi:hypothetical protein
LRWVCIMALSAQVLLGGLMLLMRHLRFLLRTVVFDQLRQGGRRIAGRFITGQRPGRLSARCLAGVIACGLRLVCGFLGFLSCWRRWFPSVCHGIQGIVNGSCLRSNSTVCQSLLGFASHNANLPWPSTTCGLR